MYCIIIRMEEDSKVDEPTLTSIQRAKQKYAKSDKGKEAVKRYREKTKEQRNAWFRQYRAKKKAEIEEMKNKLKELEAKNQHV